MRRIKAFSLALAMTASFGSVVLAQAQPAPADSRPDSRPVTTVDDRRDHGMDLGWLGLLGLVGLFGLKRREPNVVRTSRTADATR